NAHKRSVAIREDQSGPSAPARTYGRRRRTDAHAQSQTARRGRKERRTDRSALRLEGIKMIADCGLRIFLTSSGSLKSQNAEDIIVIVQSLQPAIRNPQSAIRNRVCFQSI